MERYSRQIILPEIGEKGQQRLKKSKVLLVGVGGLGSPIAFYLTGAGIGTLGVIDPDKVSITNLQRQILYSEAELGQNKALCAKVRMEALNSEIKVQAYPYSLNKENALKIIRNYDIVVDGCDNFETRYLINDTCSILGKPYVYGAISAFEGQVSVFNYRNGPTYRNLFPNETEMPDIPTSEKGVMGITPAVIGSIEASEVIKIIGGFGNVLSGKLWTINLQTMETNIIFL